MQFIVDSRITQSCHFLGDWPLSRVFLKNNANYPWLILVPRQDNIQELVQLSVAARHLLMDEISALSEIVTAYFKPEKINIATLGNSVSQLHVHVVARYIEDLLWPQGIWQQANQDVLYDETVLNELTQTLSAQVRAYYFLK